MQENGSRDTIPALYQITTWAKHSAVWHLPATNSRWCVGTNTGGDTGGDGGGDTRGATWGGLCWCCKPVLLEVPAWHSQLLHRQKINKWWHKLLKTETNQLAGFWPRQQSFSCLCSCQTSNTFVLFVRHDWSYLKRANTPWIHNAKGQQCFSGPADQK